MPRAQAKATAPRRQQPRRGAAAAAAAARPPARRQHTRARAASDSFRTRLTGRDLVAIVGFIGTIRARGAVIVALGRNDPRAAYLAESKQLLELLLIENRGKVVMRYGEQTRPKHFRDGIPPPRDVPFQDALDELRKWAAPDVPFDEDPTITNAWRGVVDKELIAEQIRDYEVPPLDDAIVEMMDSLFVHGMLDRQHRGPYSTAGVEAEERVVVSNDPAPVTT